MDRTIARGERINDSISGQETEIAKAPSKEKGRLFHRD